MNRQITGTAALALLTAMACYGDAVAKSRYTSGGKTTDLTTYATANRQRFESAGSNLIQQCDTGKSIQVDASGKNFVALPLKNTPAPEAGGCGTVAAKFTDTGERKVILGLPASRYKMVAAGCGGKATTEIDGWYAAVQLPMSCPTTAAIATPSPGFALQYTMTSQNEKGVAAQTVSYELTSLQVTSAPLDPALFEAPGGFAEMNVQQAAALRNPAFVEALSKPKGKPRIGIASQGKVALDQRLTTLMKDARIEAVPLGTGTPAEIEERAKQSNVDYILFAELGDLKAAQGSGGVGRKLAGVSRMATGSAQKESFDATLNYRLLAIGASEPRLAASANGSSGNFGIKDALQLARLASQFVMPMMMMSGMNANGGMFNVLQFVNQSSSTATSTDANMAAFSTAIRSFSAGGTELSADEGAAINSAADRVGKAVIASLTATADKKKK